MRLTILFLVLALVLTVTAAPAPAPSLRKFIKWVGRKLGLRHRAPPVIPPPVVNGLPVYSIGDLVKDSNEPPGDPILAVLFARIESVNDVGGCYRVEGTKEQTDAAFNDLIGQYPAILGGAAPHIDPNLEINVAASLAKRYLRNSVRRLLPLDILAQLSSGNLETVRAAVLGLTEESQIVLEQILEHILALFERHSPLTSATIGAVLANSLFEDGTGTVKEQSDQIKSMGPALQFLIEHKAQLFLEAEN